MIKKLLILLISVVAMASCAAQKDILYFQDAQTNVKFESVKGDVITLKQGDVIFINVSSKNTELAAMFNIQSSGSSNSSSSEALRGYTVNSGGNINFPILGEIYVEGLTREEVISLIKNELISKKLVNDAVVNATYQNLNYYILGEVSKPGKYAIDRDQVTILEALSSAGDLTIYGKRDRVFLTRKVGEKNITYNIDIRSQDLYQSPAFYVQQNDLIYVEPNQMRANQSTVSGNSFLSASFWMSFISFVTTMTLIFVN